MPATQEVLSSSDKLYNELVDATDASIGIIVIRCAETEVYRVVDDLYTLAMSVDMEFQCHTMLTGWSEYSRVSPDDTTAMPFDPVQPTQVNSMTADVGKAFEALDNTLPQEGFYAMLDLYFTFGEPRTQAAIRRQAHRSLSCGQRLFLVVPTHAELPEAVAPLSHVIDFGYPDASELKISLYDLILELDKKDRPDLDDDEVAAILANGQGMTKTAFDTAIALAITGYSNVNDGAAGIGASDFLSQLREYKTQLLLKTNVLELQKPVPVENIGGLDLFIEWMEQRSHTFTDEAAEQNITPSKGALVIGPPGTGKSLLAAASGSILNLPVIRFDVGRVFGSFIGQSEQSMRSVLTLLDAMAPCVLMLDEIDKGFAGMSGGSGGDNGTTMRVFGTFLTWMQERNQKDRPIFLIMTANRVGGLPPELLRKGRIDEIWSVNTPNREERATILEIHARLRGRKIRASDIPSSVRITDRLVGAEIEALVEDALVISLAKGKAEITAETLEEARSHLKPMSDTRKDEFKAMEDWAKINARPASSVDKVTTTPRPNIIQRGSKKRRPRVKPKITRDDHE